MNMNAQHKNLRQSSVAVGVFLALTTTLTSLAQTPHLVDGLTGTSPTPVFTLAAKDGYISTPEGNSIYFWGLASNYTAAAQYTAPTLIVNQGDQVTVDLTNHLPVPVSLMFPGHTNVVATELNAPTALGFLTREAGAADRLGAGGGKVRYTFTASEPGTYTYYSGTQPDLQIEMGLVGALIVRPTGFDPGDNNLRKAYNDADPDGGGPLLPSSAFDHEYLFVLTEMDESIHDTVEAQIQVYRAGGPLNLVVDTTKFFPVYWFINGRCAPDTMSAPSVSWLPNQPYDCMPLFHPGQNILMRCVGGGRDPHPFHHHGNNSRVIAYDGRLCQSPTGVGADLAMSVFTIPVTPGGTVDSIFNWTGKGLGWDVYGHVHTPGQPDPPLAQNEDPADHLKPFPVILPGEQDLVNGMFYSGSPFLGNSAILPPGEGGFNANGGLMYMWHSHNEREIVNNNIFPGGMLTMLLIDPWP